MRLFQNTAATSASLPYLRKTAKRGIGRVALVATATARTLSALALLLLAGCYAERLTEKLEAYP